MTALTRSLPIAVIASAALFGCGGDSENGAAGKKPAEPADSVESSIPSRLALGTRGYWEPVPDDGVELGLGWDSREGRIVSNRCIRMAPVRSSGQTTVMSLDEVSDRAEVMKALKVSAAGSVKTMFASASGSASFARSTRVSSQSTTLLMNATVTNGAIFAAPADAAAQTRSAFPGIGDNAERFVPNKDSGRLTFEPWALALMKRPAEFRAHCGDGYVSAISSGARLLASFTFSARSVSERKAAAAKFKASYGPANISGSAAGSNNTDTSNTEMHVRYMQVGGARGAIATTKEALDLKLAALAGEAWESPRFQDMRITPYAQMAEWRGGDAWRDSDDEYELIAETYWQLVSLADDIEHIVASYSDYHPGTGKTEAQLKDFLDDILLLRRAIYSALSNEAADQKPPGDDKEVSLFAATAQSTLTLPGNINLRAISDNPSLGTLADELKQALPFGNAALLRINLPVPVSVLPTKKNSVAIKYEAETLQQAVIDMYITPVSRRACERDPTDNNCMSYAELASIRKLVPVTP